ncbi:mCG144902, partial [Mus musculus]
HFQCSLSVIPCNHQVRVLLLQSGARARSSYGWLHRILRKATSVPFFFSWTVINNNLCSFRFFSLSIFTASYSVFFFFLILLKHRFNFECIFHCESVNL